ncbi:hypothetical protein BofuT4_uP084840.1 [Botrytis cinerea T4]|uniref:Uncharacterized protein n=1 Tax=Botryotinia fuckeliana (strain T4) TaxID=999810 RepID=G2YJP3_BOTF4|nr:hypothetical protein BofuT4_uP084840.1 [Botrytis cinerea T4]
MHCFPGFYSSSALEEVHEIRGEIIHGMKLASPVSTSIYPHSPPTEPGEK